jgi:hypothetical protein
MSATLQQAPVWASIRRAAAPEVRGLSAESHDRLHVRLRLNIRPSADWVSVFEGLPTTEHAMAVRQDEIYLNPPDSELALYVREADRRIEAANRRYESSVLPAMRASQERQRLDVEESARRIGDARLEAASLLPATGEDTGRSVHASMEERSIGTPASEGPDAPTTAGL